jgi:hypothetical protein
MAAIQIVDMREGSRFMPRQTEIRTDIRVLGPSGIEDYYAHLLRLDHVSCFPATDDGAIATHCLRLLTAGAIFVGAYVDGVMRAAAEIVPDRTARRAEAAITIESGFDERNFGRMLTERIIDEARRYHLNKLRVLEQGSATNIRIVPPQAYVANG